MRLIHFSVGLLPIIALSCSAPDAENIRSGVTPGKTSDPAGNGTTPSNGTGPGGGGSPNPGGTSGGPVTVATGADGKPVVIDENPVLIGNGPATGSAPNCGDGILTDDEACDDHNTANGDGCAASCLQVEPGYSCAAEGQLCRPIAVCGDGIQAPSEQCDDLNAVDGDGCSARCRVEFGKKCEGTPSVCTPTECGDGKQEGAESCDDGNSTPFDGCSSLCLREPDCTGPTCVSDCGDGLVINEDCDDGNTTDGDGCSSTCMKESGFTCTQISTCEKINGECVLRVPAIFRDFSDDDTDFGWGNGLDTTCGIAEGDPIEPGIAKEKLDADGRPVLGKASAKACIKDVASFAKWFRNEGNVVVGGSVVLFDNKAGGFVNRWGAEGEPFTATVGKNEMQVNGTCNAGCTERTRNGLQCDNECRPSHDKIMQANNTLMQATQQVTQATADLDRLNLADPIDEDAVAAQEAKVAAAEATVATQEAAIATLQEAADACDLDCQTEFDASVATCVADCKPCASPNQKNNCTGGTVVEYDGSPLFFPVDSVMGRTRDQEVAKIPAQYGYDAWPDEPDVFPGADPHNFYFTSEVQYWFRYETTTNAKLEFTGDDDVFVFVNGHLAVDLGGIHVPMDGAVTINAQSAAKFELTPGNVYRIAVFQAERKMEGSSFKLTLSGFEATPSDCTAICGDNVLSFGEECDDGTNDGGYGECDAGCKLGPYCGDGEVQGTEDCDNGPGGGSGCPACRKLRVL